MAPSAPPLILLPPSEGKAAGGDGGPWARATLVGAPLDRQRARLARALAAAMRAPEGERAALLGVKGDALAAATKANRTVLRSPTMAAIERYTGVLYEALAYAALPAATRRRVDAQVLILSGLWGVVAPRDPIPDYKLKMGASLPDIGRLSTWWRTGVSAVIDEHAAGRAVWNLLPHEHAAAWLPGAAASPPTQVVTVRFLDEVRRGPAGGVELVTVSHWNKLMKGALVRHVVATQAADVDALAGFTSPQGYVFRPDLTVVAADGRTVAASLVKPLPT